MKDADAKKSIEEELKPPNAPWIAIPIPQDAGGCLSVYYSDPLSRVPVREVTRPGDNKSDPNIETLTYGLFSTCGRAMRSGMVGRGDRYLFFATKRGAGRVLTGYYDLCWYAEANSAADRDFSPRHC